MIFINLIIWRYIDIILKKGIIINTILKNVYAFRNSQNSITSFKKIVLNGSLLFTFNYHMNSTLYELKKFICFSTFFVVPFSRTPHILSTFCVWVSELGSTKLYPWLSWLCWNTLCDVWSILYIISYHIIW